MAEKKSKITIGPDGTIHVDDANNKPKASSKAETPNQSKKPSASSTTQSTAGRSTAAQGDTSQNQESSDDSGCLGIFVIIVALIAGVAFLQFGLGIPVFDLLLLAGSLAVLAFLFKCIFSS